jgi:hypothetical protein
MMGGLYVVLVRMDAPADLGLDLDLELDLDLGLGIPLLPDAAPCAQSGSVAICRCLALPGNLLEIFFPAYLRPCAL